jgi:hypothetical protein
MRESVIELSSGVILTTGTFGGVCACVRGENKIVARKQKMLVCMPVWNTLLDLFDIDFLHDANFGSPWGGVSLVEGDSIGVFPKPSS